VHHDPSYLSLSSLFVWFAIIISCVPLNSSLSYSHEPERSSGGNLNFKLSSGGAAFYPLHVAAALASPGLSATGGHRVTQTYLLVALGVVGTRSRGYRVPQPAVTRTRGGRLGLRVGTLWISVAAGFEPRTSTFFQLLKLQLTKLTQLTVK
jgi:hypothetical protein